MSEKSPSKVSILDLPSPLELALVECRELRIECWQLRARVQEMEAEVVRLRGVLSELASEACAGDAICSTMEPDRDLVIANGVDPDVCQCFRATARKALQS